MDLYKYINKWFVYPLYYFRSGDKRLARLKILESNQYLNKKKIDDLTFKNVKEMIEYAYNHVGYYREIMNKTGVVPADIKTIKDIEKIPPLTKKDIQENADKLISEEYEKSSLLKDASGGSTGEPTIFFKTLEYHQNRAADQIRHDRWSGWDLGDRFSLIWGAQRDLKSGQSLREFIISRYIARIWELDAFEMSKEKMDLYVKTLERIQPKMVLGYANALTAFSEFLLSNYPNHKIRPKGVISSAETLTENKRKIIERAFHCKVLNRYGSREVGLIASECSLQSGLHINSDNVFVEVVNNSQAVAVGESGDILVTDLSNKAMPLIRYKLGDVGRLSDQVCKCGRGLPLLNSVEGRSGDFFVSSNGSLVHGEYFTHLFYGEKDVKKFQMIQETMEKVSLKIVSEQKDIDLPYIQTFIKKTKSILGEHCIIDVNFVLDIPPPPSGKTIFTISKVAR